MSRRIVISALAAIGFIVAACFVFWMGGYDFDTRNQGIGEATFMTLSLAGMTAFFCFVFLSA